ncbi:hypothetical protein KRR38_12675 [Novosphingobium sp. G106]|uniref:hypothetical protein n=1 Tax=Novosphingobium sp. G106 TaxID=2849500 RepID=UPI001C2D6E48|nr:hypothetical protein [Novosphingobium sp. G106]MBV1688506.1 hypothetical protein [Novosphingobium sp. G106]
MALVMILMALIIVMGCGAIACRRQAKDSEKTRYIHAHIDTASGSSGVSRAIETVFRRHSPRG